MITCILIVLVVAGVLSIQGGAEDVEKLIDGLREIRDQGYGFAGNHQGTIFSPMPETAEMGMAILAQAPPPIVFPDVAPVPAPLELLVREGTSVVPALLAHLDDGRCAKIPPVQGMWTSYEDEPDVNWAVKGVPRPLRRPKWRDGGKHTITVGDLCFVALGQIVNRRFAAARYQPTGGVIISSPTESRALCTAVRNEYEGFTIEKHRQSLSTDLLLGDRRFRREGAYCRLVFYFPDDVEPLVLKQLEAPAFDRGIVNDYFSQELLLLRSPRQRKRSFYRFVMAHGPGYSDGVLERLFSELMDLERQREEQPDRPPPPIRECLADLFGYRADVRAIEEPPAYVWDTSDLASFMEALRHDTSKAIDNAIHQIFLRAFDVEYLAVKCIGRLRERGFDGDIMRFCERQIAKPETLYDKSLYEEFLAFLKARG